MATVIYRCPATQSLHLINGSVFARVRPVELFAIDDTNTALIADLLDQGVDVDPLTPITEGVSFGNPDHAHAHNPFVLDDP